MNATGRVEYSANNSGGSWWLADADWYALEAAGWTVAWAKDQEGPFGSGDRCLGALATRATRDGLTLADAIAEWEKVTGKSSSALGCSCCGTPHSFDIEREDGTTEYWSPDYPSYGEPYGGAS